jgi:hypothetical protein
MAQRRAYSEVDEDYEQHVQHSPGGWFATVRALRANSNRAVAALGPAPLPGTLQMSMWPRGFGEWRKTTETTAPFNALFTDADKRPAVVGVKPPGMIMFELLRVQADSHVYRLPRDIVDYCIAPFVSSIVILSYARSLKEREKELASGAPLVCSTCLADDRDGALELRRYICWDCGVNVMCVCLVSRGASNMTCVTHRYRPGTPVAPTLCWCCLRSNGRVAPAINDCNECRLFPYDPNLQHHRITQPCCWACSCAGKKQCAWHAIKE